MKFGKEFRTHLEETLPEWREKFLCYKPLKKLLKHLPSNHADADADADVDADADAYAYADADADASPYFLVHQPISRPWIGLQDWFVRILNEELEKFNDFYVDKEEDFVIRLQELKERIEKVKQKSQKSGIFTSESEFSEEMLDIRKDFVSIHGEMVLLKNYSSLNFAGLVKILKKYDKRTGGLLRLPFTQRALHQPFFTTEPLTRLVRECEANLEHLFPLEAEVIESTPPPPERDQTNPPPSDILIMPSEGSPSIGEVSMDIYRSTLAAMRTIQGLRKASSTYNPLSFASFYQNQDDSSVGAVTAENSASNSPATTLQDDGEEDAHSTE